MDLKKLQIEDYKLMLSSNKLSLNGKRWWKFFEFSFYITGLTLVLILGSLMRILKVGYLEWQDPILIIIPTLFVLWWLSYKKKELIFFEIRTPFGVKENHTIVINSLKNLNWYIKKNQPYFLEAFREGRLAVKWGRDMISILIDNERILINSICNLDIFKNQALFTFGRLKRNINEFANDIQKEMQSN